ncbi:MAG: BlaI/MecI/CopY family transcriptional regulator [Bacteroidetes bacterium]|nr:MAG: BlaI/MecI/CopY family transcriptional regulator [Bacteroidota bacterium]
MAKSKKYHPTESEMEILQILWEKEQATVREVHEVMEAVKDTGYTTTLKTMQNMTDKGLLERDTDTRTHVYRPLLSREKTQESVLNKMLNGLFKGSESNLVMGALSRKELSKEEIIEIQNYLKQFEQE